MSLIITEPWQELALEMLANPMDHRSIAQFCEDNHVSTATYHRWKRENHEAIYAEAAARLKKYTQVLRIENYKAIALNLRKSFNDRKLMAQLLGDLIERTESKHEFLTPDQKREKLNQLLSKLAPSDVGPKS